MPRSTSRQARAAGSALMVLPPAPGPAGAGHCDQAASWQASTRISSAGTRLERNRSIGQPPLQAKQTWQSQQNRMRVQAPSPLRRSGHHHPAGTGKPVPARRARLATLVPNSACPGGVQPCGLGQRNPWWVCVRIGVWLAIVLAPCSGAVLAARMVLASVGGHGPQPEVGELIDDLLQLQGRRAASAWPGLGLRSGEQTDVPVARVEACRDSDGTVRGIDNRVGSLTRDLPPQVNGPLRRPPADPQARSANRQQAALKDRSSVRYGGAAGRHRWRHRPGRPPDPVSGAPASANLTLALVRLRRSFRTGDGPGPRGGQRAAAKMTQAARSSDPIASTRRGTHACRSIARSPSAC
jgi:hypothetical protein